MNAIKAHSHRAWRLLPAILALRKLRQRIVLNSRPPTWDAETLRGVEEEHSPLATKTGL